MARGWALVGAYAVIYSTLAVSMAFYLDKLYAAGMQFRAALFVSVAPWNLTPQKRLFRSSTESRSSARNHYVSQQVSRSLRALAPRSTCTSLYLPNLSHPVTRSHATHPGLWMLNASLKAPRTCTSSGVPFLHWSLLRSSCGSKPRSRSCQLSASSWSSWPSPAGRLPLFKGGRCCGWRQRPGA